MKRILLASAILLTLTTACKKTGNYECIPSPPVVTVPAAETAYLQTFLTANNIAATEINGMFYTLTQGTGAEANVCKSVTIDYVGNLINGTAIGTQFDASPAGQPATFQLSSLITAWQIAIPLIKVGGTITMYCPPSLAYGNRVTGSIPANSYLKFIVSLRVVN